MEKTYSCNVGLGRAFISSNLEQFRVLTRCTQNFSIKKARCLVLFRNRFPLSGRSSFEPQAKVPQNIQANFLCRDVKKLFASPLPLSRSRTLWILPNIRHPF